MVIFIYFPEQNMKFFDTFSGIGGFALPLTELGHKCVGFSEIDRYAQQVYLSHFPSHHSYGDITKLDAAALPDFDLLVGGFPCQAFSVAGKRRGFLDTRGTLFFDLCRVAEAKRPRLLLFENVKGLLNHAGGDTFGVILSALDDLGYDADWQVCNSKHFGVPQNRERVFIVGHLRGQPGPEVFPLGDGEGELDATHAGEAACAVTASYADQNKRGSHIIGRWVNKQSGVALDDTAPTLRASRGSDIRKMPVVIDMAYTNRPPRVSSDATPTLRSATGGHHTPFVFDLKAVGSQTRRGTVSDHGYTKTLDHDCYQGIEIGGGIRRLTPIECERLQGFPDDWTAGLSDTQRYKCLGNAVTVNVVREIVTRLTK